MGRGQPIATLIAARILGPLLVVFGIALISQRARMLGVLEAFTDDDNLLLFAGAVSLVLGLTLVALHDHWAGITQALISLIGWLAVLRGLAVLFAPNLVRAVSANILVNPQAVPIIGCGMALVGLWLVFAGFTGRPDTDD